MNINFQGEKESYLFPDLPYEGEWAWFVPGVNDIDATLTTTVTLPISIETTINFWTWYELEEDFDFAFLSVSTDGGATWQVVAPNNAIQGPFGPAFSGKSGSLKAKSAGWTKEEVSLWRYSGQEVMIRFEVLTDSTIAEGGFAVGDITFEAGGDPWSETWLAEGFVQSSSTLAKAWSVQLIPLSGDVKVTPMLLDAENAGSLHLDIGEEGAVIIVSALGPVFGKPSDYQIVFDPATE